MKGGDPGIRLIEPIEGIKNIYFKQGTAISGVKKGEWIVIPVYQIFGSEELSSVSPAILQKIHERFVIMNQNDAEIISKNEGDYVQLEILKTKIKVKIKIDNSLQHGLTCLSVNLPGMPFVDLPGWGKFHKL
jgi:NADH-quinone oxidoreductase subunit G